MAAGLGGLIIRRAEPQDKDTVLAFCRETWEDGDYIHYVFDRWVSDKGRALLTAELDGVPVGIASFVKLDSAQGWLEGLRVDPRHRGKGIASALNLELAGVIEASGVRKVRFATHGRNEPVHKMAADMGFLRACTFRAMQHESAKDPDSPLRPLSQASLPFLEESLSASSLFEASRGLYGHNWGWRELTPERLSFHIGRGEVVAAGGSERPDAWAIAAQPDEEEGLIGWIDGRPDAVAELARLLISHLGFRGSRVYGVPPTDSYAQDGYGQAGFEPIASHWGDIWVFERVYQPPVSG
jgi:GNAT superfamily N-acetyltransferase